MKKVNGGQAIVEVLKANQVNCVFGLLGGSMLELYDALYSEGDINYVGARDERAAAHMADAYARINGGVGVVFGAQSGPGVANLVTGVAEAHLAYSPLIVIAGLTTREHQGAIRFRNLIRWRCLHPFVKNQLLYLRRIDYRRCLPMRFALPIVAEKGRWFYTWRAIYLPKNLRW